jgi:hypothetical protein
MCRKYFYDLSRWICVYRYVRCVVMFCFKCAKTVSGFMDMHVCMCGIYGMRYVCVYAYGMCM